MQMVGTKFCFRSQFHRLDESKVSKGRKKKVKRLTSRQVWERTADSYSGESESGTVTAKGEQC
jgi:hypothetical protein